MEAELKRIQLVENSFERIKQKEGNLTLQFYQKLFEDAPQLKPCLLYTSPSPRDLSTSRMPSSA